MVERKVFVRALLSALAVWGLISGVGLLLGRLEIAADEPAPAVEAATHDATDATGTPQVPSPRSGQPADRPAVGPAPALRARRYTVCGREEAPPRLFELSAPDRAKQLDEASLWGVSCGASVHVVAFDSELSADRNSERAIVFARRIARVDVPSPAPDRAPRPASIVRLDEGAATSWLVATLRIDRNGSPAGGALFRVPLLNGNVGAASLRVHDAAPGELITASFDREPGQDFALLQLGEARAAQPSELWLFSGGPSPLRIARLPVELGATPLATLGAKLLATLDLDGDAIDEAAVLSPATGRLTLLSVPPKTAAPATPAVPASPPIALEVAGAQAVQALDLDGDGRRELIASGDHAYLIRRNAQTSGDTASYSAVPLTILDGLRDLALLDVDADGKLDVIGYAHPELISISDVLGSAAKRSTRLVMRGADSGLSVLAARLTHLDGDSALDALVLATRDGADPQVELIVAQLGAAPYELIFPSSPTPLRGVPLPRQIELR